jgi:hypothetical protein
MMAILSLTESKTSLVDLPSYIFNEELFNLL